MLKRRLANPCASFVFGLSCEGRSRSSIMRLKRIRNAFAVSRSQSCKMSSMMLSASLASVKAYDAFNLSPITVVARMLASHRISVSSNSRAIASALFAAFRTPRGSGCLARGNMRYAPCCRPQEHCEKPSRPNRPARLGRKARTPARWPRPLRTPSLHCPPVE